MRHNHQEGWLILSRVHIIIIRAGAWEGGMLTVFRSLVQRTRLKILRGVSSVLVSEVTGHWCHVCARQMLTYVTLITIMEPPSIGGRSLVFGFSSYRQNDGWIEDAYHL
jgi:hypothetical protein